MLNYIYFRYNHWLIIALLLREHLCRNGEKVVFVCPNRVFKYLEPLGFIAGKDFCSVAQFVEHAREADCEFNFLTHHNDYAAKTMLDLYRSAPDVFKGASISFYADGYTNKFLQGGVISSILSEMLDVRPGRAYTFDNSYPLDKAHLAAFDFQVVSSMLMENFMRIDFFARKCERIARKYIQPLVNQRVALLIMRPWGSEKFQRGFFATDSGAFDALIVEFLRRIYGKTLPPILIRPDSRDPEYMGCVVESVVKRLSQPQQINVIGDDWPAWVNMDVFIYHLTQQQDIKLDLFVFDSSAASPFFALGRYDRIFVGFPKELLDRLFEDEATAKQITRKVYSLENLYLDLQNQCGPTHITRLDESLVCIAKPLLPSCSPEDGNP